MAKAKIFISYSSKDSSDAEAIHKALAKNFDVWRDQTRLETDWSREIALALAGADFVCLLWSEGSSQSKWVKHEWLTARALEKRIVPCLFPGAPSLPEPIHNLHGVSFSSIKAGCRKLIERIEEVLPSKVEYEYKILPPKSYIPFIPNPHFTGRHSDLLELYLKMIGNLNKIGINQVGLVGMGGTGKTQIAVEFAYRFSFGFPAIYWIQAADPEAWLSEFVSIARDRLQLDIKDSDKPEAAKQYIFALQNHFKENPGTLVVMDNVVEPKLLNNATYLFGLTPSTLGCDLLFTTRRHFKLSGVSDQQVSMLSSVSAYDLLKSYRTPNTPAEEKHARSICNAVGYLPLAITLAGAYLEQYESDISLEDYTDELARSKLDVIDIGELTEEDLATRHVAAVGVTLRNQWEMLKDEDARRLFQLVGQLPEAAIIPKARLGLLAGIRQGQSKIDHPLAKAFNHLHSLSLIERMESDASAARLHPLVREFSFQLVPEEDRAAFRGAAAKNLKDACFDYEKLDSEFQARGGQQIIEDFKIALEWWGKDGEQKQDLELLECAIRYSAHVLAHSSDQLAGQLLGRLMSQKSACITSLLDQAKKNQRSPWLRPLTQSLVSPGGPLLKTLSGQTNEVLAVAVTSDGQRAISGSWDSTLKVWDLETGAEIMTLSGPKWSFKAEAVTSHGRRAISGSWGNTLKVWDLETGAEIMTLSGHTSEVSAVAVTSDGWRAISGSRDNTLKVWDLETGAEIMTLSGHTGEVSAVAVASDGRRAISGSRDRTLKVWDLETGAELKTLSGHTSEVSAVAVTSDGRRAISGSRDRTLKVWDLETGAELKTLSGHTDAVNAVAVTSDGRRAISGSWDRTLKVWDLETRAAQKTVAGHTSWVSAVAVTSDGQRAISGSSDGFLKVWDLETGAELKTLSGHTDAVLAVAVTSDGRRAISGSYNRSLTVWDLETGAELKTLSGHTSWVSAVAVSSDGRRAISGSADKTLKVWNLETGKRLKTLKGHTNGVEALALTADGRRAISAGDRTLKVWDLETGAEIKTLSGHTSGVSAVAVTSDGRRAISGSQDSTLKVWDLETGAELKTLSGHTDAVYAVAVTSDGRRAISSSRDHTLKVWDIESGNLVANFFGEGAIYSVQFAPKTKTIVAGDASGAVHFLRLENVD